MENKIEFLNTFAKEVIDCEPTTIAAVVRDENGKFYCLWYGDAAMVHVSLRELQRRIRYMSKQIEVEHEGETPGEEDPSWQFNKPVRPEPEFFGGEEYEA